MMQGFEAIVEECNDGFRVIFGRRLADGTFQVSYSRSARYYKTEKKARVIAAEWNARK